MRFQLAKCVKPNMQTLSAKMFPVAVCVKLKMNDLTEIGSLKKRNGVKPTRPKNHFKKKIFQKARICRTEKFSQVARTQISKNLSNSENLSKGETV